MKLRIHHQSLRFRLSPRDIENLIAQKIISDQLELSPTTTWFYKIEVLPSIETTALKCNVLNNKDTALIVEVPEKSFMNWLSSHEIEWEYEQLSPQLQIIIEKDLKPNRT